DEGVVGVEGLLRERHDRQPRLDRQDRQAGEPQREGDGHPQDDEQEEDAEQNVRGLGWREHRTAHQALPPSRILSSSTNCSPRNTIQVSPAPGQATWIIHSGRSASSEVRYQAKRVNSVPARTKTRASASTPSRARILMAASARRDRSGHTSTSKCELSRTPTMAPIMIVQMNRKRAISSVQM